MSKFTRRELAALSTSAVVLARAQAQTRQTETQPQAEPANPDEDLKAWETQLRTNAAALDAFPLAMATHPATTFKP
jgi:hypothetical protein